MRELKEGVGLGGIGPAKGENKAASASQAISATTEAALSKAAESVGGASRSPFATRRSGPVLI